MTTREWMTKTLEQFNNGFNGIAYKEISDKYNLVLAAGWVRTGDGEEDYTLMTKICIVDDLPDYEWAEMPYDEENGLVYNTECEFSIDNAEWYDSELKKIEKLIDTGELTATYLYKFEDFRPKCNFIG